MRGIWYERADHSVTKSLSHVEQLASQASLSSAIETSLRCIQNSLLVLLIQSAFKQWHTD